MTEKEFKDLEKEFCDYETSVALKELGFTEKCLTYYDTEDNVGLLFNTQWTVDVMPCQFTDCLESHNSNTSDDNSYVDAPTIYQVQKWLRKEKCIDVEIHAATDMLGTKAYMPYVSTYTTFKLYEDDDEIRYRQKKVTTLRPLPNEIIPAHSNFPTWEEAAIDAIEFVINKYL